MADTDPSQVIRQHLRIFFAGHACEEHVWTLGPAVDEFPRLRVSEFAPGPKIGHWVYATIGAWEACDDPRLEFLIIAPGQDQRLVELLFMTAWYHGKHTLGTGHTFPIGEPWLPGSSCDFFLVSLPYPFGHQLEVCQFGDRHLHFRWLLPITAAEREFKLRKGIESLEQRFETRELEYWLPGRASAV